LVRGIISETKRRDGRRQFSGQLVSTYWFAKGSSGSPLFKQGGQQLAAVLSMSELGANNGQGLYEAFVVPASVMRKYVLRVQAKPITQPEHLSRAQLDEVLREIGAADVPSDEALARLKSFIQDAKARAVEPLPIIVEGGDVPEVIAAARAKAGALDTAGAVQILEDRLAQEGKAHEARMVALLREKAAMEGLSFRREEAIATMLRLLALAPAAPWDWINLGDLYRTQGRSTEARDAYQRSMDIAERLAASDPSNAEWQRDLSVSHNKIGEILQAQGNLAEALAAYQRGMDIAERLAASDPSNAVWQRDLSVSHDRIGDILRAQGNLAEALAAYQRGIDIRVRLAANDPSNAGWQRDLYFSHNRIGDILQAQGDLAGAFATYQRDMDIAERLAASDPTNTGWQRDLVVSLVRLADAVPHSAREHLTRALAIVTSLAETDRLAPSDTWMIENLKNQLRDLGD
jgi:tetratricopeptide (TPR) repeat protein